ncbi:MAG: hypothetical protein HKL85_02575 [Acidimicrobiaceae bacterium]|nr:hypothetical protein [Acidimicrobiaceae bacterium]
MTIVTDAHQTKGRSTLEDQLSSICRLRPVELGHDARNDVAAFGHQRVNAAVVRPTRDRDVSA